MSAQEVGGNGRIMVVLLKEQKWLTVNRALVIDLPFVKVICLLINSSF